MNSPIVKYGVLAMIWIAWYGLFYSNFSEKIRENETLTATLRIKLSNISKEKLKLQQAASSLKNKEMELERLKKSVVPGDDPQVVASNLQNLVLTYASQKKIDVLTYRTSSTTRWKGYKLARTTFTFKCNRNNFVDIFRFFDTQKKLIRPSRVNIVWVMGRNAHLRVVMDIEALVLDT